jgi:hypothetical protein
MALWVSVFQMEPAALHVCAKHSPTPAAQQMDHSAGHHHSAPTDASQPTDESAKCCTCPDGCATAQVVTAPSANVLVIPAARLVAAPTPEPRETVRPASAARLLPFANGPPSLV